MAVLSTPAENAQKVLEIFSHFRARPGHILRANSFVAVGGRRRWEMSDLQQGLDVAAQQGWTREKGGGIELTDEGFAKMPQNT